MTLTTLLNPAPTLNPMEPKKSTKSIMENQVETYMTARQVTINVKDNVKDIVKYDIAKSEHDVNSLTIENFLCHLSSKLKLEFNQMQDHCACDENLVQILDGQGVFYNRLIIILIKIENILSEQNLTPDQKTKIENQLNLRLTGGKINLIKELGNRLNYLEKDYLSGVWQPEHEDQHLFSTDTEDYKSQLKSQNFSPKWMHDINIAGIPISQATLAYWNFRHANPRKHMISDKLIQSKDPGLYHWLSELKRLKAEVESSTAGPVRLPLSKLHIAVIDQRLSFADTMANSVSGFREYHWTGDKPERQKATSRKKVHKVAKPIQQAQKRHLGKPVERETDNISWPVIKEKNSDEGQLSGIRRAARKHKRNVCFTASKGETSRKKLNVLDSHPPSPQSTSITCSGEADPLERTLERTRIPMLVSDLQKYLDDQEHRLMVESRRTVGKTRPDMMDILSARDELSRLNHACKRQLKRPESAFYTGHSDNTFKNVKKASINQPSSDGNRFLTGCENEDKNPDDYQQVVVDIIPECQQYTIGLKSSPEKERITLLRVEPDDDDLKKAKDYSVSLINEARKLLFDSKTPDLILILTDNAADNFQGWQYLETVINLPLISLNQMFNFVSVEKNIETLLTRKKNILNKILKTSRKYHDKSGVWHPSTALEALNSHWEELMELQYQLYAISQQMRKSEFESHSSVSPDNKLPINSEQLRTELRQIATVLQYLTSFSLRLGSNWHQQLSEKLIKSIVGHCKDSKPTNLS